jgi:type I restriction enzyme, R subunit
MLTEAEWLTRKNRIDTRLRALNPQWQIVPWRENLDTSKLTSHAVTEFPTENGPADYALFVDGKFLGIIEAKKVGVGPQNVLEQAKRYSSGAFNGVGNWNGYRVPFLYSTNGEEIWHIDMRDEKPASHQINGFHTVPALAERFARDLKPAHNWLLDTPTEQISRLRPYQRDCIMKVENAVMQGRHDLMVAMATGTGKTFLTVAQIYRLLESKFARRILFLVDRKALAAQAVREFNAFNTPRGNKFTQEYEVYSQRFQREDFGDDEPFNPRLLPNEYLTDPKPSHTFVCIWTIQRLARTLFGPEYSFGQSREDAEAEDAADRLDIPIHAFDVIIADECHRGYL